MTLLQIACKNISRDKHTYFSYYISSTVTILLFFLFLSAAMHPDLNQIQNGSSLSLALAAGNFIIYIFAFLFIGYSSFAFWGARGKQLGIYTILGMSQKQMRKMLFGENVLIGTFALISGLVSGILFSGLFFKLIRNIFETVSFKMYVPIIPIVLTIVLFMILFLAIGFTTPFLISHKKIISLLKSDKSYARNAKVSIVKIVSSLLLFTGTIGLLMSHAEDFLGVFFTPAVLLCVMGAVFLLTPQIGTIYVKGKQLSAKHWKGIHLFSDSESSAAVRENEHMMSLNAILLAVSFLAICALGSLQSNTVEDVENITPFAYMYIERDGNVRAQNDINLLDQELLKDSQIQKVQYTILKKDFSFGFLKESDFNNVLSLKGEKEINLKNGQVLALPGNKKNKIKTVGAEKELQDYLENFGEKAGSVQTVNQIVTTSGAVQTVYVIKDELWNSMKNNNSLNLENESYTGYEDPNWLAHLALADKLELLLKHDDKNYDYTYGFSTLGHYYATELLMRKLCLFVGFSISLIFLISSVSLIYFRLYTSLEREKEKYLSLYKLGFSLNEMGQTVRQKISILLWIPFGVAMLIMWCGIIYIDSLKAVSIAPTAIKYSFIFIAIYFIFYSLVVRLYRKNFVMK